MSAAQGVRAGRAYVEMGVNDSGLVAGLRAAEMKLKAFGQGLQSAGTKLMGLSAALAVPFALSAKAFGDFEQEMSRVKALTDASADEFAALEKEAKKLGNETIYSATQAAEAMSVFAKSGKSVNEILKATGPTLALAAAGKLEMAEAGSIVMNVMAGMNIQVEDLNYVVDLLAKAMTTANTDLVGLGEAMKFVGPNARAAGVSLEEITAAIQILSDAGLKGEMAGTTLRGMILTLASPSQEAKQKMRELGIVSMDAAGNFLGLSKIITQFQAKIGSLGTGKQLEILGTIFPDRQAANFSAFLGKGADGVMMVDKLVEKTEALKTASDNGGVAARVAGIQMNTLWGAVELITSSAEGLAIVIGQAINPVLREWGAAAVEVIAVLTRIAQANGDWLPVAIRTVAVIGAVGAALVGLGLAVQVVAFGLGGVATALGVVGAAFAALLSPIGLTVAAVAGLTTWWATSTKSGVEMTTQLGQHFREMGAVFSDAWGGIVGAVQSGDLALAGQIAWAGLNVVWLKGTGMLSSVWNAAADGMFTYLTDTWANLETVWIEVVNVLQMAWLAMTEVVQASLDALVSSVSLVGAAYEAVVGGPGSAISGALAGPEAEKKDPWAELEQTRIDNQNDVERRRREANDKRAEGRKAADQAAADRLAEARKELADAVARVQKPAADEKVAQWVEVVKDKAPNGNGKGGADVPGSAIGMFDAGRLDQMFGDGSGDKRTQQQVDELRKANALLTKIIDALKDQNLKFQ